MKKPLFKIGDIAIWENDSHFIQVSVTNAYTCEGILEKFK